MHTFLRNVTLVLIMILIFGSDVTAGEYEDFLKGELDSFQSYKDERDAEFIGFLKEQWVEFQVNQGIRRDVEPKPVKLPIAKPVKTDPVSVDKSKKIKKIIVPKYVSTKKTAIKPVDDTTSQTGTKPKALEIDFYSTKIVLYGSYKFPEVTKGAVDKKLITNFWDKMSQLDYDSIIKQVQIIKREIKLNDWGYHHVLYRIGMKQFAMNKNMANMFVWYMSSKSGYESRIGYDKTKIYLLMPSRNRLFSVPFLTLKSQKYYSITFDSKPEKFKSLYTYKGQYPKANKLMDYRILDSPQLEKNIKGKTLSFKYMQKKYSVRTQFNKNLVGFFKYYPQTNIKVYFEALTSAETEYALIKSLKPIIENKTEAEAVNILLRFVQKAFKYKTDDVQFGREKYLLMEETLYYPYSDCEDRSIFFAYLVKKLVGLDVVGLDYPGHIATAVKFSNNFSGDYIVRNNKKYMVCDPTYINSKLGMAMPKFKKLKPKIVRINSL